MSDMKDIQEIKDLRDAIEHIDKRIITLMAARFGMCSDFAVLKAKHNMKIHDPERESILHRFYEECSKNFSVNPVLVRSIFELILAESKRLQQEAPAK